MKRFRDRLLSFPGVRSHVSLRLRRVLLTFAIAVKWHYDRRYLPLTEEHRQLYEIIHRAFWRRLQDFPHLVRCRDFNDRMQWLKLFDQTETHVHCADKLAVRDYVKERLGEDVLIPILAIEETFDEINFDLLPDSFVIKTNNASGIVILVRDKACMNIPEIKERIEYSLNCNYGWLDGEWIYSLMPPKIIIEELMGYERQSAPPDFKFHCVNGRVRWMQYVFDRGNLTKEVIVDHEGKVMNVPLNSYFSGNLKEKPKFDVPEEWSELIHSAEVLAKDWKYVRVDFYLTKEGIKFGELTMYPHSGCYKGMGQRILGQSIDFDRSTFREPVYKKLSQIKS